MIASTVMSSSSRQGRTVTMRAILAPKWYGSNLPAPRRCGADRTGSFAAPRRPLPHARHGLYAHRVAEQARLDEDLPAVVAVVDHVVGEERHDVLVRVADPATMQDRRRR